MLRKRVIKITALTLCAATIATSVPMTAFAAKKKDFEGWNEINQADAWDVYSVTDWQSLKDMLILENLKSDTKAVDISFKVSLLRDEVKEALKEMDAGYGIYKNTEYTELILAMIQVISDGKPDKNDPCGIRTYIDPTIPEEEMTKKKSIQELFKRISYCEKMQNGAASVYAKNATLLSLVQGTITLPEYTKQNPKYSVSNAQAYIDKNKEKLFGEPTADFAEKVSSHYSAVEVGQQYQGTGDATIGKNIVEEAKKYIGNPYVYGGNSLTKGIDCSGFTKKIHEICGIKGLPRTSSAQRASGKEIKGLENALPGDVICYSGHVAIYMGNNEIIHASNPSPYPKGGIKTTKPANYKTILSIRRYW